MLATTLLLTSLVLQGEASSAALESLNREVQSLEEEIRDREARTGTPLEGELATRAESLRNEAIYLRVKSRKHVENGGEGTGLSLAELSDLRQSVAKLRDDLRLADEPLEAGSQQTARPEPSKSEGVDRGERVELPVDTVFAARLLDSLSSDAAEVGDRFEAVTVLPVTLQERVVIPEGARVFGAVEAVERAGRTHRKAKLVLAFDRLEIEGKSEIITATVVGASEDLETGFGDEKKKLGIGAGVGGVLGAVLGGGAGAVAGAIIGGSGIILGTEGKDVELPRGTMLQLRLDRTLSLPAR